MTRRSYAVIFEWREVGIPDDVLFERFPDDAGEGLAELLYVWAAPDFVYVRKIDGFDWPGEDLTPMERMQLEDGYNRVGGENLSRWLVNT